MKVNCLNFNPPFKTILALVLLIPLAFAFQTFDKFGTIKMVIFLFGCSILLFYLLMNYPLLKQLPRTLNLAIALFLAVQIYQTLRLTNPLVGLFGEYGQSESLLVQTGFMILFWAGFLFINDELPKKIQLIEVITIVAFFVSIFGIGEYYLGDLIARTNVTRIKSFFGDPNSLGAFLILTLPLILTDFWSQHGRRQRFFSGLSFYTGVIALYLTFSRAAWAGFFIGGILVLLWGISRRLSRACARRDRTCLKNLIIMIAIIGAGLISGIILTYFQPREHADYNLKARVTSIARGNDSGRGLLWSIALKTFKHSPWLGDGSGSFSKNFHLYESIPALHFWNLDRDIRQVHNEILQYLATQGLCGAFSYLCLLFVLFWFGNFRDLLRRTLDLRNLSLWAAILGYLVFIQFAYPLVHYTFLVWIYWGILVGNRYPLIICATKRNFYLKRILIIIALIAITCWGWFLANMFRADIYYRTASSQEHRHLYASSLTNYRKAITLAPFQYQYRYRYVLTLYSAVSFQALKKSLF